jgi:outer membrane protein OmpA-like peptidoglycan-associated protein
MLYVFRILGFGLLFSLSSGVAQGQILLEENFDTYKYTDHSVIDFRGFAFTQQFPKLTSVPYWPIQVCSCTNPRDESAKYYNTCDGYDVEPHSGCNYIRMVYGTRKQPPTRDSYGGSPYLTWKTDDTLRVGNVYRLSTWIYLRKDEKVNPARLDSMARNIGVQFFHRELSPKPYGNLYIGAQLLIDTVRYEEWYEVKWTFAPTCNLSYMALGVFRNNQGPPAAGANDELVWYLDDLKLEQLATGVVAPEDAVGVCRFEDSLYVEDIPQNLNGLSVYFASNSSELDKKAIDALAVYAKGVEQYPGTTFILRGYADKRAGDNKKLSEDRIAAVQKQLKEAHRILPFRMLSTGFGDSLSQLVEDVEARRVDIITVPVHQASLIPYRYALEQSWEGNIPEAMRGLRMWQAHVPVEKLTFVAYDPRAAAIRKSPVYREIQKKVNRYYKSFPQPIFAKSLDSLWFEDQRYRTLDKWIENLNYYDTNYDAEDTKLEVWFPIDSASMEAHDAEVLVRALELLDEYGWPEETQVGKRAATAIPLAIIHSNNEELITKYLPVMRRMCLKGEGHWRFVKYMEARLYHLHKEKGSDQY